METSKEKIKNYILKNSQATAKELKDFFKISSVLVHRHLKTLCKDEIIKKIGSAPKVFYIPLKKNHFKNIILNSEIIENNWLSILPNGEFLYGEKGFSYWCEKRKMNIFEKKDLYEKFFKEKKLLKRFEIIEATEKIESSFSEKYLEKLWYVDFYSWEIFGKTLLGSLILYAKQNSDLNLMQKISQKIESPLKKLIKREKFDEIVLIPHSVPRKYDFLKTTLDFLDLEKTPQKYFEKIFSEHVVAQKTLKSKIDREQNAEETLFLIKKNIPSKVLLIDDACGSGSTLQIAAKKIKKISPSTKIFAITFVGSIKEFEVIAES